MDEVTTSEIYWKKNKVKMQFLLLTITTKYY